jgi:hypothetical protein
MSEKYMLILGRDVVEKIDRNRDDLTREEFIDFCINACMNREEPAPVKKNEEYARPEPEIRAAEKDAVAYATKKEFQEFKTGIADILRTFLEFFLTFGLELGKGKDANDIDYLKTRLRKIIED